MFPGLTTREIHELQFSVGKTTRGRRPLFPVEVGELFAKCMKSGATKNEITAWLQWTDKGMVPKFLRVKDLNPVVRHLVSWGFSGDGAIGFSVAAQLARLPKQQQPPAAEAIMKHRLSKEDMTSVIQLLDRSKDSLEECVNRVVRRRPVIQTRQIVLGLITSKTSVAKLHTLSQLERDGILESIVRHLYPGAKGFTAKLGTDRFAIIGGSTVAETVANDSKFEQNINQNLERALP